MVEFLIGVIGLVAMIATGELVNSPLSYGEVAILGFAIKISMDIMKLKKE